MLLLPLFKINLIYPGTSFDLLREISHSKVNGPSNPYHCRVFKARKGRPLTESHIIPPLISDS